MKAECDISWFVKFCCFKFNLCRYAAAADYSAGWSARPTSSDGRHPAAADPQAWSREALLVSAEMGSTEARLAVGDRILHGRGADAEVAEGPNCEAALDWIRPVVGLALF